MEEREWSRTKLQATMTESRWEGVKVYGLLW
jgi:hypothetical protein